MERNIHLIHPAFKGTKYTNIPDKNVNIDTTKETLNESATRVLSLIKHNPNITATEIAIELNISSRTVQKQIANLKSLGIIERIGSDKSGYWSTKESY